MVQYVQWESADPYKKSTAMISTTVRVLQQYSSTAAFNPSSQPIPQTKAAGSHAPHQRVVLLLQNNLKCLGSSTFRVFRVLVVYTSHLSLKFLGTAFIRNRLLFFYASYLSSFLVSCQHQYLAIDQVSLMATEMQLDRQF